MSRKAEPLDPDTRKLVWELERLASCAEHAALELSWARQPDVAFLGAPKLEQVPDFSGRVQALFAAMAWLMSEMSALAGPWEVELEPGRSALLAALEGRVGAAAAQERFEQWEAEQAAAAVERLRENGQWAGIFALDWEALRAIPSEMQTVRYPYGEFEEWVKFPIAPMSRFYFQSFRTRAGNYTRRFEEWMEATRQIGKRYGVNLWNIEHHGEPWLAVLPEPPQEDER